MGLRGGGRGGVVTDGQVHDGFFAAFRAVEEAGDRALVHDDHALALAEDLLHVAADHHHGDAFLREGAHEVVNLRLRADIDAAGGLVKDEEPGIERHPFGEDNLLHSNNADKRTLSASLTIVNLTNKYALYNFLSTFSGTHFVTPRSITGEVAYHF